MEIVRRVALPCLVVIVLVTVVAAVLEGRDGLFGAALGGILALAFLASSPGLLDPLAKKNPTAALPIALGFFTVKAVAAIVVLAVLLDEGGVGQYLHRASVAVAMVLTALTWIVLHLMTVRRSRTPIYDLE
jgi:ATP synthase protein I